MPHYTLIIGIDLGTSSATASHARVLDEYNREGRLKRKQIGRVTEVTDWPGCIDTGVGNPCVPTDLIYDLTKKELISWGFDAQDTLDGFFYKPEKKGTYIVETIKLLVPDPDETQLSRSATLRYNALRHTLVENLGKKPLDVFEEFLLELLKHIFNNAQRKYSSSLSKHHVELVLAFPSGWRDQVHTSVAQVAARALRKAIEHNSLQGMMFGVENVYTVSETLCGIKEWLRENVGSVSVDSELHTMNLDELDVGDCFLPVDIGGGTGCLTPLRLVSKSPLAVDQLGRTQSLEVSGEAVQAQFEQHIVRRRLTANDINEDLDRVVKYICRRFRDQKKKCGTFPNPNTKTWDLLVSDLKANAQKRFENNCMIFTYKELEECFDPVLDILRLAIEKMVRKYPEINTVVFLGQFGGSSEYLRSRMKKDFGEGPLRVKYSQSGKLDVVKGAMTSRLNLEEVFVRKFRTTRSYGTLVDIPYNDDTAEIFPDPESQDSVGFIEIDNRQWLRVIAWAVPKDTLVHDGHASNIGRDGSRFHTWRTTETDIGFYDRMIISDEDIPPPCLDGYSYTLWTNAHETNQLFVDNKKVHVDKSEFGWDLNMSQKFDAAGNLIGAFTENDLQIMCHRKTRRDAKKRKRSRVLHYDLIWEITEMQVKVHVMGKFPNQVGPRLSQLAKELDIGRHEKVMISESRSQALEKDIWITDNHQATGSDSEFEMEESVAIPRIDSITSISQPHMSLQAFETLTYETTIQSQYGPAMPTTSFRNSYNLPVPTLLASAPYGYPPQQSIQSAPGLTDSSLNASSKPNGPKIDRRRRKGCYTCKDRKKKCDGNYAVDERSGTPKCGTCSRFGVDCLEAQPDWARDPVQRNFHQNERRRLVKLGKRKAREDSECMENCLRERSMTIAQSEV